MKKNIMNVCIVVILLFGLSACTTRSGALGVSAGLWRTNERTTQVKCGEGDNTTKMQTSVAVTNDALKSSLEVLAAARVAVDSMRSILSYDGKSLAPNTYRSNNLPVNFDVWQEGEDVLIRTHHGIYRITQDGKVKKDKGSVW